MADEFEIKFVKKVDPEKFDLSQHRLGIVAAKRNGTIVNRLLKGAHVAAKNLGITEIETIRVPGTMEIPLAAKLLANSGRVDMIIAVGCVISGATSNSALIANVTAGNFMAVQVGTTMPMAWGVITANYDKQAYVRSSLAKTDSDHRNLAEEAVYTVAEMAKVKFEFTDDESEI